jgi:pilus assembly protein CpaB
MAVMNFRSIVVLVLAGVCGLSAAVALLSSRGLSSTRGLEMGKVVVAAVEIHRGELITDKMLRLVDWPKSRIPDQSFSALDDVVGRVAVMAILADDLVFAGKVAKGKDGRGLAPLIPEGMRAFTILTPTDASLVAGFIVPDHHVDVVLTVTGSDESSGGGTATVLLQNVRVLAVGQHLEVPRDNKMTPKEMKSITLAVTPEQAAKLSLAQTRGTLHLSLRSEMDSATAAVANVTLRELRFQQGAANSNGDYNAAGAPVESESVASSAQPSTEASAATAAVSGAAEPMLEETKEAKEASVPPPKHYQIRVLRGLGGGAITVQQSRTYAPSEAAQQKLGGRSRPE